MVRFGSISGQPIFGQVRLLCQNKQLYRKFRVRYCSVWVNSGFGFTFGCAYFGESGMGPGHSVQILSFVSVLPGLVKRDQYKREIKISKHTSKEEINYNKNLSTLTQNKMWNRRGNI